MTSAARSRPPLALPLTAALLAAVAPLALGKTIEVPADHATIQLAVDHAGPGDKIVVSKGEYRENVVVPATRDGLVLKADGAAIVDASQLGDGFTVLADDVRIVGFTIRHAANGVRAYGPADRLTLLKLTVLHGANYAFWVDGDDLLIEDCDVRGCQGTSLYGDRTTILDTTFRNDGYGVYAAGDDLTLNEVRVVGSDYVAFYLEGDRLSVTNCKASNTSSSGMYIGGDDVKVAKCVVTGTKYTGIYVTGHRSILRKNVVSRSRAEGIETDGSDVLIEENEVVGTAYEGIVHAGSSGELLANVVSDVGAGYAGVWVEGDGNLVVANAVSRVMGDGIAVLGHTNEVRANKVKNAGCGDETSRAFIVEGDDNTVHHNVAKGNAGDGIAVDGERNYLFGNEVEENLEDGIQILTGSLNTELRANRLVANLGEGLENAGALTVARENVVKKNRLDVANIGSFALFVDNVYVTGGPTTAPEIDT